MIAGLRDSLMKVLLLSIRIDDTTTVVGFALLVPSGKFSSAFTLILCGLALGKQWSWTIKCILPVRRA